MGELLDSLRDKDEDAFHRWTKSEAWATVEQLLEAHGISLSLYHCYHSFHYTEWPKISRNMALHDLRLWT